MKKVIAALTVAFAVAVVGCGDTRPASTAPDAPNKVEAGKKSKTIGMSVDDQ